jgi:hypothetical protein
VRVPGGCARRRWRSPENLDAGGSAEIVGATTPGCHDEPGHVLSGLDPLTLTLRLDVGYDGRDIADDLTMVELVASLPVIQTAGALPTVLDATAEDDAPYRHLRLHVAVGRCA